MEDTTEWTDQERGVGNLLGTITCLQEMGQIEEVRSWLATTHQMPPNSGFFQGYRLALETLIRVLHHEIRLNQSLGLTEDDFLYRASFVGKPMWLVPNSSEKGVLLRNLATLGQPIIRARSWRALRDAFKHFSAQIVEPIQRLETVSHANLPADSVSEAKRLAAMFQLYIFLNDTGRGLPHGYFGPVFENDNDTFPLWRTSARGKAAHFFGYKLAVQFCWSRLLGRSFQASPAANLHSAADWRQFDSYFDKMRIAVIAPIEEKAGHRLDFNNLLELEGPVKQTLGNLITNGPPERALSERDQIDRTFLWYNVHILDGSESNFAGVPAFIPLLLGWVEIRRQHSPEEMLRVIRIIHGTPEQHRRDYSYAVLIESYGTISDSSGWILFYNCCSDQGSTSPLYAEAEKRINQIATQGLIQVETLRIDKRQFLNLISHRLENVSPRQLSRMRADA